MSQEVPLSDIEEDSQSFNSDECQTPKSSRGVAEVVGKMLFQECPSAPLRPMPSRPTRRAVLLKKLKEEEEDKNLNPER